MGLNRIHIHTDTNNKVIDTKPSGGNFYLYTSLLLFVGVTGLYVLKQYSEYHYNLMINLFANIF